MELKISEEYQKIVPQLKPDEFEALKTSLEIEGQLYPIIVNSQGIILDGMHRFKILGKDTKYEVRDFPSKEAEKEFVITVNLKRRHLNDFQKAEMGIELLKIIQRKAEENIKAGTPASSEAKVGRSTEVVGKQIGLSHATFERARKVIEEAPEEIKSLCRKEALPIAPAYGVTKAFETVPEISKKTLTEKLVKGDMEPKEIIRAIASTNAVKAKLEGEEDKIKEKAEELFKDQYYTREFDAKTAIWQIEEIAGDPHQNIQKEYPLDKFATFEEAQAYAVERNGVCIGKIEKWLLKIDPVKTKKLDEAEQVESES